MPLATLFDAEMQRHPQDAYITQLHFGFLSKMSAQDPEAQSEDRTMRGVADLHLEAAVAHLMEEFRCEVLVANGNVP